MFKKKWYINGECSRYMTEETNLFSYLEIKKGGKVKFGDNTKGKIDKLGHEEKIKELFDKLFKLRHTI